MPSARIVGGVTFHIFSRLRAHESKEPSGTKLLVIFKTKVVVFCILVTTNILVVDIHWQGGSADQAKRVAPKTIVPQRM